MDKGTIVLLGHGSRRVEANAVLVGMAEIVKHKFPYEDVGYAFLEFAEPNIRDFLEECVSSGSRLIYVIPYFLYAGNHVHRDIPKILRSFSARYEHLGVVIKYGDYLGIDERLGDLVVERITAVKAGIKRID